ncbi:MAG: 23S rRNA (uridine(2552)-2'-O)-methyltransferase RlmE [Gammaproteobacteria bacterium]|nr:23S rRNA (uridine(2552)-2'-O)-methyltransferase RlmE [Gammaproteobacteria bacterium]
MGKSKSSRRWLREHFSDPYVKQAQRDGYRSRAVYKLLELHERDRLFQPGSTVIDLGAAPGGWSQVLKRLVGVKGRVIALDLLPIEPIAGVEIIQGDFTEESVLNDLLHRLGTIKANWVLSDMAPDMSGLDVIDQPRAMELAELTLDFAKQVLHPEGGVLIKTFQGEGFDDFLKELRATFHKVVIRKPKASRDRSREMYLLARKLK